MNRLSITASAVLLLIGCSNLDGRFKDTPEGSQSVANLDEAGSVHVAVVAVVPWNDIKTKLRPEIPVDPKTLRAESAPTTQKVLDRFLSVTRAQLAIAPTIEKNTSTSTTTSETGKDDVTKSESTTESLPGTPRAATDVTALAAGAKPASDVSGVGAINSSLSLRAMASYKQEIEAINSEVDFAASRTGYTPYLMRIQISVMPRRRHLGYDVYSILSAFSYTGTGDPDSGESGKRVPTVGAPFVVPLLSSDSIETSERSQSTEALRELSVALDLIKGFGAIGFGGSSQKDRQQALQGLDVNSIMTLGRLADNALNVRLGAANDPAGGYATHPRTNTISVLTFFPKNANVARIVARSSWKHVSTGVELHSSAETYAQREDLIIKQWPGLGLTEPFLESVDEYALEGNYRAFQDEFKKHLAKVCSPSSENANVSANKSCTGAVHRLLLDQSHSELERTTAYVWTQLLSLLPGGRFSTSVVHLPKTAAECPIGGQLGVYTELESGISVALRGGNRLNAGELKGAVHWGELPDDSPVSKSRGSSSRPVATRASHGVIPGIDTNVPKTYGLLASGIAVLDDRKTVALAFDSNKMVRTHSVGTGTFAPLFVELSGCSVTSETPQTAASNVSRLWSESQLYPLTAKIPKKEKEAADDKAAKISMSVSTETLLLNSKNIGDKTVVVDLGPKPDVQYAMRFLGSDIVSVGPDELITARNDGTFLVKASGPVKVRFRSATNQDVDIELRAIDEKGKTGDVVKKLTLRSRGSRS